MKRLKVTYGDNTSKVKEEISSDSLKIELHRRLFDVTYRPWGQDVKHQAGVVVSDFHVLTEALKGYIEVLEQEFDGTKFPEEEYTHLPKIGAAKELLRTIRKARTEQGVEK